MQSIKVVEVLLMIASGSKDKFYGAHFCKACGRVWRIRRVIRLSHAGF